MITYNRIYLLKCRNQNYDLTIFKEVINKTVPTYRQIRTQFYPQFAQDYFRLKVLF